MLPNGAELVSRWREAGAWWEGESPREVIQFRERSGRLREVHRSLPSLVAPSKTNRASQSENNWEDIAMRPRKLRDEKVAMACGFAKKSPVPKALIEAPLAALHALSGYSFGRSILFAEEIPRLAAAHGFPAVAIADHFALTGAYEFAQEAKRLNVHPLIGATIQLECGGELVLIAKDRTGYVSLSRLITSCHLDEPRLFPMATRERIEAHSRGLLCLTAGDAGCLNQLLAAGLNNQAEEFLKWLVDVLGSSSVFLEIERSFLPWERKVNTQLMRLAQEFSLTAVAGGKITHEQPKDYPVLDVLTCSESLCPVDEIYGTKPRRHPLQPPIRPRPERSLNGENYWKSPERTMLLFRDNPELVANTIRVAQLCDPDVLPSRAALPQIADDEPAALRSAVNEGIRQRYKKQPPRLLKRIDSEVTRIIELGFSSHFLVAWDMCRWATEQGILFSGRGSVVDCAVSYCLGFSRINAYEHNLLFDRFLPADGSKRPDIDIDFEARRRDDVRAYLTQKYGRDHVATVAAIGAFNTRGIVREVGKALGIPQVALDYLSKRLHGGVSPGFLAEAIESRPELRDSGISRERFHWVFRLSKMLADVPRNMRAHSSGVVISQSPISETVPMQWSATTGVGEPCLRIIQWDKRSAKHVFDKFDILCLRGQDVLSGTQNQIRLQSKEFDVEQLAIDDPEPYRAMRSGELIGVPQSASPAMRQAHVRLRTENLVDASLVQAGIRPGVGGAVKINELIARRRGAKAYNFDHPELERILGHTYGIVVFQEQIDELLQSFCGYSSGEAEEIRDKIHKRRREDYGQVIRNEVIDRIAQRGFTEAIAAQVFEYIAGFKGYGFAQGHALAFAEISVRSIACQQNFPAEYFSALLSAQPAGYYGPCTIANEARVRGVKILHPNVNASDERFKTEDVTAEGMPQLNIPNGGIRTGLMQVAGLSAETKQRLYATRKEEGPFRSMFDFTRRVLPDRDELESMILTGCFDSFATNRRALLFAVVPAIETAHKGKTLFDLDDPLEGLDLSIIDFTPEERCLRERALLGMDVDHHLMAFDRERVCARGVITTEAARRLVPRLKAIVVGNPIRLRFPPTPSGKRVVFFDLEDETGLLNVTCFDAVYRCDGHAIICSPYVTLVGESQDRDGHTAFLAKRVFPYTSMITKKLTAKEPIPIVTADFLAR